MGRFSKFVLFLNVLIIVATFCAYLSPYISPIQFWQFSFFGLVYPWLLLCNFFFAVYWVFLKKKWALASFVCILLGAEHIGSFVGLNFFTEENNPNQRTIMSYNIRNLMFIRQKDQKYNIIPKREKAFIDFMKREEEMPILCTQESSTFATIFIQEKFNYPYHFRIPKSALSIFSNYPIINKGEVKSNGHKNYCIWVDIKLPKRKIRIYNMHLHSNHISSIADNVVEKGDPTKKQLYKDLKKMMGRFRFGARQRGLQAEKIAEHIATSPHPVIVCGDFNDTPQSYTYHTIAKNLKDTFKQKGWGFGTTYAGNIPALHIDHILVDKKINVHSLNILKGNYSDHYPVVSKISLP